jgi:hypothetical protein
MHSRRDRVILDSALGSIRVLDCASTVSVTVLAHSLWGVCWRMRGELTKRMARSGANDQQRLRCSASSLAWKDGMMSVEGLSPIYSHKGGRF